MKYTKIEKKARQLLSDFRGFYCGLDENVVFGRSGHSDFSVRASELLRLPLETVYRSTVPMLNQRVSESLFYKALYSLAANESLLRGGQTIPVDGSRVFEGDLEIRFLDVKYLDTNTVQARALALTGTVAQRTIRMVLKQEFAATWCRCLGYKYGSEGLEPPVTRLALPGLIGAASLVARKPDSEDLNDFTIRPRHSDPVQTHNRKTIRTRAGYRPCPRGLDAAVSANYGQCVLHCRYGWDSCPHSGHAEDREVGRCVSCGKENVVLASENLCVRCQLALDPQKGYY